MIVPYSHQKKVLEQFLHTREFALFLEMGLGKTKIVLDWLTFHFKENHLKRALVFAPKSVVAAWEEEIPKHSMIPFSILLGTTLQKKKSLMEGLIKDNKLFVTNYEAVLSMYEDLDNLFDCIILDESTYIKNPMAKRTKLIIKLGQNPKVKARVIMSGLPITNSALDIWAQFRFLDKGKTFGINYWGFRNKYFYSDYNKWHWYPKNGSLEKINKKIYTKAVRMTKEECLDLPEKIYEKRIVELPKKIRNIYDELKTLMRTEIEEKELTVHEAIVKVLRLRQIANGTIPSDEGLFTYSSHKLEALKEIIEENPDKKIIIWCNFIEELKMVSRFLKSNYVEMYGDIKNREEIIEAFQNDPEIKYFVGQIRTAGMGITLTSSSLVVYFSNSFSLEARKQSEDRAHRIGQKYPVVYVDIIAKKTIDEYILKILRKKMKIADITLSEFLEEVL